MYFAYIDESGKPDINHPQNEFVLSAFIIHEQNWFNVQESCNNLKYKIWNMLGNNDDPASDFEVHIKEINNNSKHYKGISLQKKAKILKKIYDTISTLDAIIISTVILKDQINPNLDINEICFKLLIEKLQNFMERMVPDSNEYLLLVLDTVSPKFDSIQRKLVEKFIQYGVKRRKLKQISSIIETPFFVSSGVHNGVQFLDATAFLVRRYIHKYITEKSSSYWDKNIDNFFKKIANLFYRDENNRVCENGLKIYPMNYEYHKTLWKVFDH
ncbi:DUF3800 domain-containing protein [Candidatus Harpocratesius sp.]